MEGGSLGDVEREVTIYVGHRALFRGLVLYGGSYDGLTLTVDHSAVHGTRILCFERQRQAQ